VNFLQGSYGTPFFAVALYTGVFYAAISAVAGRRLRFALAGFLTPFLAIIVPMFILTRFPGWGSSPGASVWPMVVTVDYIVAIWATVGLIGALAVPSRPARGAAATIMGSLSGYAFLSLFLKFVPMRVLGVWNPMSYLPAPVNLLDGLLSGGGLCAALKIESHLHRRLS
jgi:hypothetical protein